jgi:hypothetical protein
VGQEKFLCLYSFCKTFFHCGGAMEKERTNFFKEDLGVVFFSVRLLSVGEKVEKHFIMVSKYKAFDGKQVSRFRVPSHS